MSTGYIDIDGTVELASVADGGVMSGFIVAHGGGEEGVDEGGFAEARLAWKYP